MYLLVKCDFSVEMIYCDRPRVVSFLCMIHIHLCHGGIEHSFTTMSSSAYEILPFSILNVRYRNETNICWISNIFVADCLSIS